MFNSFNLTRDTIKQPIVLFFTNFSRLIEQNNRMTFTTERFYYLLFVAPAFHSTWSHLLIKPMISVYGTDSSRQGVEGYIDILWIF